MRNHLVILLTATTLAAALPCAAFADQVPGSTMQDNHDSMDRITRDRMNQDRQNQDRMRVDPGRDDARRGNPGWNDSDRNARLQQDVQSLDEQISRAVTINHITRRRAGQLHVEARNVQRLYWRSARGDGLTPRSVAEIRNGIDRIHLAIGMNRPDWNRRTR